MFKFRTVNSKETFAEKVKKSDLDPEIKEIFLGRRTIFSLIGFIVGGILFGNGLWQYTNTYIGTFATMLVGLIVFIISGVLGREFKK